MTEQPFSVEWLSRNRKAQCPPNPAYPNGKDVSCPIAPGQPSCQAPIPYPASECGVWVVRCLICKASVGVTAAGRPDDPRSVRMPCKLEGRA
jgi:hypothetical protein